MVERESGQGVAYYYDLNTFVAFIRNEFFDDLPNPVFVGKVDYQ